MEEAREAGDADQGGRHDEQQCHHTSHPPFFFRVLLRDMTFNSPPPEVEEELAALRKAVNGLRAGAADHRRPQALEPSDPAVLAVAKDYDQAMQELTPLGFSSLGDVGEQRKDGSIAVSRWFGHSDGSISGWLGFITTKRGPRLLAFLVTEASGPIYCTSLRGGTGLSLARPPMSVMQTTR